MKQWLTVLPVLLCSLVGSASAAPVLYSFNFTGTGSNPNPAYLSFQYLSPAYLSGASPLLTTTALSNISIDPNYSLFTVELSQSTAQTSPSFTFVTVQTTLLEKFDFNQAITINFNLPSNASGPNVYLDRDGTYALSSASGPILFSVTATPEPAPAALLLLTLPVAWLYGYHRQKTKEAGEQR